jgi:hypothetical protein
VSDAMDREEIHRAFAAARRVLREAEGAGRAPPEPMAFSILRLLEYAVATGDALSILAKAFTSCFGYLKSQLPIEAFEPLRVAFHHDEHGAMEGEGGGGVREGLAWRPSKDDA